MGRWPAPESIQRSTGQKCSQLKVRHEVWEYLRSLPFRERVKKMRRNRCIVGGFSASFVFVRAFGEVGGDGGQKPILFGSISAELAGECAGVERRPVGIHAYAVNKFVYMCTCTQVYSYTCPHEHKIEIMEICTVSIGGFPLSTVLVPVFWEVRGTGGRNLSLPSRF